MDAKYLGVTLSNDLEWSKHIATMTNKANSKLSSLRRNLKGCPEKHKQTAYFSLIRSFMEYGATVWDPYQKYNSDKVERVQRRAARFVKSRYSRYSSVSDMLYVLGWTPLSQRRQEARLILFYKIINGLAQVPFEGVFVEAYKGTRRKHNMKFRQIGIQLDHTEEAPNDTAYKRWNCHSGLKLICKLCRTLPPPATEARFTVLGMLDGWRCCSQKPEMSRSIQVRQH